MVGVRANTHSLRHESSRLCLSCSLIGFLFLGASLSDLARILYVWETIYFEGNDFIFDVLEEAFCDNGLSMSLLITKLWITILTFNCICFELCLVEVDRVLNKYVLAEVGWEVSGAFDAHYVVDLAVQKVFRYFRKIIFLDLCRTVSIKRDHIHKQTTTALIVSSNEIECRWIVDEVSKRLHYIVALSYDGRLMLVDEWVFHIGVKLA